MLIARSAAAARSSSRSAATLQVAILTRPFRDEAINDAVWSVADEQVVAPEARRALEANGLRVGLITGDLPAEVECDPRRPRRRTRSSRRSSPARRRLHADQP